MFSVVIPTLQRSSRLRPLVDLYCGSRLVNEIIVVNNAPERLWFPHGKVTVLNQSHNLFVNPSWNLGVSVASSNYLIISNDDIEFDPRIIDATAKIVRGPVGIVGPWAGAFRGSGRSPWFSPAYRRTSGFGTLMFMRSSHFVRIPDDLLIWCGDDWLFNCQRHRNFYLRGSRIETQMSTTAGAPEFAEIKAKDLRVYKGKYDHGAYDRRFPVDRFLLQQREVWKASLSSFRSSGSRSGE